MNQFSRCLAVVLSILLLLTACAQTPSEQTVVTVTPPPVSVPSAPVPDPEPPLLQNPIVENKDQLDQQLDAIAAASLVRGYSVAAFDRGRIVYSHSWGMARNTQLQPDGSWVRSKVPASGETKYRVASVAKMVTAVLAMTLYDADKLDLDADLSVLVDSRLQNKRYPQSPITPRRLMAHTSSIIDGGVYSWALRQVPYPSLDELLSHGGIMSGREPGTSYSYSNLGMGLLSAVIEKQSGEYLYDYAKRVLFDPMGLDASYLPEYLKDPNQMASFAGNDPLAWVPLKQYYTKIPKGQMYLLGHGDLYISANDLARVAMILAGDGTWQGQRYLSQEAVDQIHTATVYDSATNVTRGLAVQISADILDGVTLYGHQGNAYGAISCVFYDPKTQRGVVFLTNGASSARAESQVYQVNENVVKTVWNYFTKDVD